METDFRKKNDIEASKHENRATDPSNSAKCTVFRGESDGTSPGPQKCQKNKSNFYILTPDQPPPAAYYVMENKTDKMDPGLPLLSPSRGVGNLHVLTT